MFPGVTGPTLLPRVDPETVSRYLSIRRFRRSPYATPLGFDQYRCRPCRSHRASLLRGPVRLEDHGASLRPDVQQDSRKLRRCLNRSVEFWRSFSLTRRLRSAERSGRKRVGLEYSFSSPHTCRATCPPLQVGYNWYVTIGSTPRHDGCWTILLNADSTVSANRAWAKTP